MSKETKPYVCDRCGHIALNIQSLETKQARWNQNEMKYKVKTYSIDLFCINCGSHLGVTTTAVKGGESND